MPMVAPKHLQELGQHEGPGRTSRNASTGCSTASSRASASRALTCWLRPTSRASAPRAASSSRCGRSRRISFRARRDWCCNAGLSPSFATSSIAPGTGSSPRSTTGSCSVSPMPGRLSRRRIGESSQPRKHQRDHRRSDRDLLRADTMADQDELVIEMETDAPDTGTPGHHRTGQAGAQSRRRGGCRLQEAIG
jgi:hypothetical protein